MTESIPMLKSFRANCIFISDNGFINRNSYFFKERIQIISMKWPVNIETYIQFLDHRKLKAHTFTYFILTLSNFRPTSKFCKFTRLLVQAYITFYSLKFRLEIINLRLQMIIITTKCHERKRKNLSVVFNRKVSVMKQHSIRFFQWKLTIIDYEARNIDYHL